MIRNTYLTCSGGFNVNKRDNLRWHVDFKNPDVKRQLKEDVMAGKDKGVVIVDGKKIKWNLKYLNLQNVVSPGIAIPVTFDMLTLKGKEIIANYLVDDFWINGFNITGDDILDAKNLLADSSNALGEVMKAFNNCVGYIEEIIPLVPDKLKYNKKFMRKALLIYNSSKNSKENHTDNAIAVTKLDFNFIDYARTLAMDEGGSRYYDFCVNNIDELMKDYCA